MLIKRYISVWTTHDTGNWSKQFDILHGRNNPFGSEDASSDIVHVFLPVGGYVKDSGVPVSLRDVSENTVRKSDEEITEEGKKEKETFEEKSTLLSQYVKKNKCSQWEEKRLKAPLIVCKLYISERSKF